MSVDPTHRVIAARSIYRIRSVQQWQRSRPLDGKIDSAQCLDLPFVELAGESFASRREAALADMVPSRKSIHSREAWSIDRSNRPPLRPDARIGKAAHQFNQGVTITWIRCSLARFFGCNFSTCWGKTE